MLSIDELLSTWDDEINAAVRASSPEYHAAISGDGTLRRLTGRLIAQARLVLEVLDGGAATAARVRDRAVAILLDRGADDILGDDPEDWPGALDAYLAGSSPERHEAMARAGVLDETIASAVARGHAALAALWLDDEDLAGGLQRIHRHMRQAMVATPPPGPLGDDPSSWERELEAHVRGSSPEYHARLTRDGKLETRTKRIASAARAALAAAWATEEDVSQSLDRIKQSLLTDVLSRGQDLLETTCFQSMTVDISASCNAKCAFCPREQMPKERSKGFMPLALFRQVLDNGIANGISTLLLYSTGEPTLHPQFDELVREAKERGYFVVCSTNGTMMRQREAGLRLVDSLQVSIEGWDKANYERYRKHLKFDRVYEGVRAYAKTRPPEQRFAVNLMLTRRTDIEQFALLWADLFDEVRFHFMLPSGAFREGQYEAAYADEFRGEYFDFVENAAKICGDPFEILTVGYDGRIMLCCNDFGGTMDLGTVHDPFNALWSQPVFEAARRQFKEETVDMCKGCGQTLDVSPHVKAAVAAEVERVWSTWGIGAVHTLAGDLT